MYTALHYQHVQPPCVLSRAQRFSDDLSPGEDCLVSHTQIRLPSGSWLSVGWLLLSSSPSVCRVGHVKVFFFLVVVVARMEWNERNRKWKHFWDCRRGRSRHCCLKGRRSWRWNNRITFFEFMMTFVPLLLLLLFTRRFPRSFPADSRPIQNACVGSFAVLLFFHSFILLLPSFPFLPCRRPPFTAAGCVCVCGKNEVFLKFFYSFGFFGWTAEISWSRPDWAGLVCVCVGRFTLLGRSTV